MGIFPKCTHESQYSKLRKGRISLCWGYRVSFHPTAPAPVYRLNVPKFLSSTLCHGGGSPMGWVLPRSPETHKLIPGTQAYLDEVVLPGRQPVYSLVT